MNARAALKITAVIGDTIRELGEVPSGHLYAHLMDRIDLPTFERIIELLKRAKLVSESGHMLRWIGPKL